MSPIKREFILYLEDMFQSMQRIEEYIGDLDFKKFKMTYMVVDAIIRNFEIIGEASKNIPTEIKKKYPEIPWRKMYGLRNLIAHEYFGVDYEMIWEIAKNNLPQNRTDLLKIIKKEKAQGGNNVQK
ncbi:Uncharacterized conserved protein, contains HEPN domain [Saccharicrinis carchari]|uniref:Uncharacterized conserved protein, contains HEPN domain n=1 Tax=Saccharicrinis carchari TaxID=1168039 RepID=A0A521F9F7_SACCC|nr:DUF86 domain-containing protein [Saccharicrinis carchari]SMO92849.1 Uncharacterized conserved protein, contains HEPN domain [Saccharicrinis carchari]